MKCTYPLNFHSFFRFTVLLPSFVVGLSLPSEFEEQLGLEPGWDSGRAILFLPTWGIIFFPGTFHKFISRFFPSRIPFHSRAVIAYNPGYENAAIMLPPAELCCRFRRNGYHLREHGCAWWDLSRWIRRSDSGIPLTGLIATVYPYAIDRLISWISLRVKLLFMVDLDLDLLDWIRSSFIATQWIYCDVHIRCLDCKDHTFST